MNTELLLQVKAAILAKPEKYDQDSFCGTECCIAGWSISLALPDLEERRHLGDMEWDYCWGEARKKMGLAYSQMSDLCSCADEWPSAFGEKYYAAKTAEERALVGAARIDHFIATNGAE